MNQSVGILATLRCCISPHAKAWTLGRNIAKTSPNQLVNACFAREARLNGKILGKTWLSAEHCLGVLGLAWLGGRLVRRLGQSGAPPCVAILRFTAAGLDAPWGSAFLLLPGIFTNTKVAFVVAKSWRFQFAVPTMVDGLPRWRSAAHTRLHKFQICTRDVPIYVGSHSTLAVALT
jgi:hypothetical protein